MIIDLFLFAEGAAFTKKRCFDCGAYGFTHDHHVVPRILGGTKTVPLCEPCHSKVHDRHMVGHIALVRRGLVRARERGQTLGRPVGSSLTLEAFLQKHADIIRCLKLGKSVRVTAKTTGKGTSTVTRVKKTLTHSDKPTTPQPTPL